jgi:hypothetical protein
MNWRPGQGLLPFGGLKSSWHGRELSVQGTKGVTGGFSHREWRVVRCGGASLVAASGWCCGWHPMFAGPDYALLSLMFSLLKMPVASGTFPRWGKSRPLWWSAVRSLLIFCARLLSLSMP